MLESVMAVGREAGRMILQARDSAVHQKEGHFNFVTDTDVAVQTYIRQELQRVLPGSRFFAEEQENEPLTDAPTFVVDPIDGTINFMRGRGVSAVSIALLENKAPVLGVIYDPFKDEMFVAEKGKGAFCNGERIHVSEVPFSRAVTAFGTSPYDAELAEKGIAYARRFLLEGGDLRRCGSAAIDLCDVACGRAEIFFELRLRPWDVAAGSLIVTEAGGQFHSIGHDAPYYDGPSGMMACNQRCAGDALRILEMKA